MKIKHLLFWVLLAQSISVLAQTKNWKLAGNKIMSPWGEKVDPTNPLSYYPRPQLVRNNNWKSLNGLWDYAIRPKSDAEPNSYDGEILVPFAVESALSGVGKVVGKDSLLWYRTKFAIPGNIKNTVLLHFGAIDWRSEIYLNGKKVATHEGGFDPFSVDITAFIKGSKQELVISVWDPTDEDVQPTGKQRKKPHGIWYTPVTGIWQTVWLEGVSKTYVESTKQTPDIDAKTITITPTVQGS